MSRFIKFQFILVLMVFVLASCAPAVIVSSVGVKPTPVVETQEVVPAPAVELPQLTVHDVQIQIGVGSPIPVDTFVSAELPDTCAQLAEVKMAQQGFTFEISMSITPGARDDCMHDTLPFRMIVPLNMVNQPAGTYTVNVNGVSTTFQWPAKPTVGPDTGMTVPAEWEAYRNDTIHFEFDYPPGWIVDEGGDLDILWSEKPSGPGKDGVPANIVKIDIVTEPNTTLTLDELVARQKAIIADNNGEILLEEPITLGSGLPAVRMSVSGISESLSLLAVINEHPVMLVGYGDLSRFDEVARTLRSIEP